MKNLIALTLISISMLGSMFAVAQEDETLQVWLTQEGMLSSSNNIDNFMVPNTIHTFPGSDRNMNNTDYEGMENSVILTALAYIDGEVAGFAVEAEYIYDFAARSEADTVWLVRLNKEGYQGFIMVEQVEGGRPDLADPEMLARLEEVQSTQSTEDIDIWLRTTHPGTTTQYASGDLHKYQGGDFVEYSAINPGNPMRSGVLLEFKVAE